MLGYFVGSLVCIWAVMCLVSIGNPFLHVMMDCPVIKKGWVFFLSKHHQRRFFYASDFVNLVNWNLTSK